MHRVVTQFMIKSRPAHHVLCAARSGLQRKELFALTGRTDFRARANSEVVTSRSSRSIRTSSADAPTPVTVRQSTLRSERSPREE